MVDWQTPSVRERGEATFTVSLCRRNVTSQKRWPELSSRGGGGVQDRSARETETGLAPGETSARNTGWAGAGCAERSFF